MGCDGCCPPGSLPALKVDEPLKGAEVACPRSAEGGAGAAEVVSYKVGDPATARAGVVLVHDIWGMKGGRTRVIADHLASTGEYVVLVPDLFYNGDNIDDHGGLEGGKLMDWVKNFTPERLMADMETVRVSGFGPDFAGKVGLVGFCWGAMVVFNCCQADTYAAGVRCGRPAIRRRRRVPRAQRSLRRRARLTPAARAPPAHGRTAHTRRSASRACSGRRRRSSPRG